MEGVDNGPLLIPTRACMYYGSIEHSRIIESFRRHVPDCYVRDYRDQNGFITVCRGYRNVEWKDNKQTPMVYRQVPAITLLSLPRGNVTSATRYVDLRLDRTGWRMEFRKARRYLTEAQMLGITHDLRVGEVFEGIR